MSDYWLDDRVDDRGAWYGPLGGLVPIPNIRGGLDAEAGRKTTWTERADGAPQAMVLPWRGRSWSYTASGLRADEVAVVRAMADGLLGMGPHWWLPPEAVASNVLTPDACDGRGWTGAHEVFGPVQTSEGWVARSIGATSGTTLIVPEAPILPRRFAAASVFARGTGAKLSIQWVNAAGAVISTVQVSTTSGGASTMERIGGVAEAPASARSARLALTGGTLYGAPALSWTPRVAPWAYGSGCVRAWLYGLSMPLEQAGDGHRQGVNFSVMEVG